MSQYQPNNSYLPPTIDDMLKQIAATNTQNQAQQIEKLKWQAPEQGVRTGLPIASKSGPVVPNSSSATPQQALSSGAFMGIGGVLHFLQRLIHPKGSTPDGLPQQMLGSGTAPGFTMGPQGSGADSGTNNQGMYDQSVLTKGLVQQPDGGWSYAPGTEPGAEAPATTPTSQAPADPMAYQLFYNTTVAPMLERIQSDNRQSLDNYANAPVDTNMPAGYADVFKKNHNEQAQAGRTLNEALAGATANGPALDFIMNHIAQAVALQQQQALAAGGLGTVGTGNHLDANGKLVDVNGKPVK